ncbi:MAG TPA: glycerate kinase [Xanthobacteraceae bacterium]|nr:glycerate kinase [Xanthobacteraceae bacterium]
MDEAARAFLERLFRTTVAAAHPAACLRAYLPPPPTGRLIVLAAGKAAGSMTEVAEQHYLQSGLAKDRLLGLAVTRHGYGRPTRHIPVIEAGHPIPDQTGLDATEQVLALADQAGADDLVLVLLSGGASANWIAPARGLALADKQATTRALLRSGASIGEVNTVRKHLSRIKGGRLAARARPARIVTLAISDVPGDNPDVIGSGPTVPDPSTLSAARGIIQRYGLEMPAGITSALSDPANETPKPEDPIFRASEFSLIARPDDAFRAAREMAKQAGYDCVFLGDRVEGEAREVAQEHGRIARELRAQGRRAVILSGGELTVTLYKQGRKGGPNQEYALALAIALEGTRGIAVLAADTDGTDGGSGAPTDPAGAFADGTTAARARALGLDPASFLANNNSTNFFAPLGDLLMSGPTFTNVNDFRAILVDSA